MFHIIAFLTIFSFILFGNRCRINPKFKYWLWAMLPITIYSLGLGLRDGWGVDFRHYQDIYCNLKTTDPVFYMINYAIHSLGVDYPVAFVAYSVILGFGFFAITRNYKEYAICVLPLLWCFCFGSVTLIRYFVGVGWILISVHFLLKERYFLFLLFALLGAGCHSALTFVIPLVYVCAKIDLFPNKKIVLVLFVLSTTLLDKTLLGSQIVTPVVVFLEKYLPLDRLNFYADTSDYWFSGERLLDAAQSELNEFLNKVRLGIAHFFILYWGFDCKDKFRNGKFFYSLTCIGLIFYNVVQGFELIERYDLFCRLFAAFVIASIFCEQKKDKIHNKYVFTIVMFFILFNLFYRVLFGSLTFTYYTTYVWN